MLNDTCAKALRAGKTPTKNEISNASAHNHGKWNKTKTGIHWLIYNTNTYGTQSDTNTHTDTHARSVSWKSDWEPAQYDKHPPRTHGARAPDTSARATSLYTSRITTDNGSATRRKRTDEWWHFIAHKTRWWHLPPRHWIPLNCCQKKRARAHTHIPTQEQYYSRIKRTEIDGKCARWHIHRHTNGCAHPLSRPHPSENLARINLADPHEELLQFISNYHFTDWAIRRAAGGDREARKMVMVNYYYHRFHMSCFDAWTYRAPPPSEAMQKLIRKTTTAVQIAKSDRIDFVLGCTICFSCLVALVAALFGPSLWLTRSLATSKISNFRPHHNVDNIGGFLGIYGVGTSIQKYNAVDVCAVCCLFVEYNKCLFMCPFSKGLDWKRSTLNYIYRWICTIETALSHTHTRASASPLDRMAAQTNDARWETRKKQKLIFK